MAPILFWRDARLAALSLCLMPFITVGAYLFFSLVKRQFKVADEAEGKLTAVLQENLTGIRVVRAFAPRRTRDRAFRHVQPGVPGPPVPAEQARSDVLGHQRLRLARTDQRRCHRSRGLPRARLDQCR